MFRWFIYGKSYNTEEWLWGITRYTNTQKWKSSQERIIHSFPFCRAECSGLCSASWLQWSLFCLLIAVIFVLPLDFSCLCSASWLQWSLFCLLIAVVFVLPLAFSGLCSASWLQWSLVRLLISVVFGLTLDCSGLCSVSWLQWYLFCLLISVVFILPLDCSGFVLSFYCSDLCFASWLNCFSFGLSLVCAAVFNLYLRDTNNCSVKVWTFFAIKYKFNAIVDS